MLVFVILVRRSAKSGSKDSSRRNNGVLHSRRISESTYRSSDVSRFDRRVWFARSRIIASRNRSFPKYFPKNSVVLSRYLPSDGDVLGGVGHVKFGRLALRPEG